MIHRNLASFLFAASALVGTAAFADAVTLNAVVTDDVQNDGTPVTGNGDFGFKVVSKTTGRNYTVAVIGSPSDLTPTTFQGCTGTWKAGLALGDNIYVTGERKGNLILARTIRCLDESTAPPTDDVSQALAVYSGSAQCSHVEVFVSQQTQTSTGEVCGVTFKLAAVSTTRDGEYGDVAIESWKAGDTSFPSSQFVGKYLRQGNRVLFNFGIHANYPTANGGRYPFADFVNGQLVIRATKRHVIRLNPAGNAVPS